jgi:N-acetyl-anhydromuramyl-L-alanine amidase AmpD
VIVHKQKGVSQMIFGNKTENRPNMGEKNQKLNWIPHAEIQTQKMDTKGKYPRKYPEGAVIHYTAGSNDAHATINWGREMGYCYLLIDREGLIYQSAPLDEWGYHAGESSYLGRTSMSRYLVGIEMISAGRLTTIPSKEKGETTKYAAWFHFIPGTQNLKKGVKLFEASEVRFSKSEGNIQAGNYHKYSEAQELSLISLLLWLRHNNEDVFTFNNVLGHDEISPRRKQDPGGSLSSTMNNFRSKIESIYSGAVLP